MKNIPWVGMKSIFSHLWQELHTVQGIKLIFSGFVLYRYEDVKMKIVLFCMKFRPLFCCV